MKTVLQKATLRQLIKAGYDVDAYVLVGVTDDLSEVKHGEIAATLSFAQNAIRTIKQNASIHKYCELLCTALNDAGMDMKATMEILSKSATIPWSPSAIKDRLWRPVQIDTYQKESTTKLSTAEVSGVYEALNEVTSSRLGVGVGFPDKFHAINYDE